jgi:hypothetical protein
MAVPVLSDPSNYDPGVNAVGGIVRADLEAIVKELDGSLDTTNLAANSVDTSQLAADAVESAKIADANVLEAHISYASSTGVLVARTGPNYAGGGSPRIAVVSKELTWAGSSPESVTFTYASDCAYGDPAFVSTPHLMGAPVISSTSPGSTSQITQWVVTASSSTAISIDFTTGDGSETVTIEFAVIGAIS